MIKFNAPINEEGINIPEIDAAIQKIKDLEAEKETAFRARIEAELNYIKKNNELRFANMEFSKLMAMTRQFRRRFPSPDKMWKDKILAEVGHCEEEGCGSEVDLQIHHEVPLGQGGTNKRENLKVLCGTCHRKKHPEWASYKKEVEPLTEVKQDEMVDKIS